MRQNAEHAVSVRLFVAPRVRVGRNELTCLLCGETFPAAWVGCPRCNDGARHFSEEGKLTYAPVPSAPTVSYLREGEFEWI